MSKGKLRVPAVNSSLKAGLLVLILKSLLSSSDLIPYNDTVDNGLTIIAVFFFAFSIISHKQSIKTLAYYGVIAVIALITSINTRSLFVFQTVMVCLAISREDKYSVIRFVFFYETVLLAVSLMIVIAMAILADAELYLLSGNRVRFHFGFKHPNVCAVLFTNLTSMWIWLNYDRLKLRHLVGVVITQLVLYYLTKCRTAIAATFVLLLLVAMFRKNKSREKLLTSLAMLCIPVLIAVTSILVVMYTSGNPIVTFVDNLLTMRIKLGAYAFENYGVSLFGQDLSNVKVVWDSYWKLNSHTFDNVYTQLLVNYGLLWMIAIVFVFHRLARYGDEQDKIAVILWSVYGLTEVHVLNPFMFFPLLLRSKNTDKTIKK